MTRYTPARQASCADDASPAFLVGQDEDGHWIAIEARGMAGGYFRSRHDALRFANDASGGRPDAVKVASGTLSIRL